MFTKDRIKELLELYKTSDNFVDFKQDPYEGRPFLKRDLVEAKMHIDRWGAVTTDWVFHPSQQQVIEALFPEEETAITSVKSALHMLMKYATALELKKSVSELTEEDMPSSKKGVKSIWGADVHYSEHLEPNQAIGVSLKFKTESLMSNDSNKITNSIIVFNLP